MSNLLDLPPYGQRNEKQFLAEINGLTRHHYAGCPEYRNIFPKLRDAEDVRDIPFIHAGVFKDLALKTYSNEIVHQRTLTSSATSSGISSRIALDSLSSLLQSRSVVSILSNFIGASKRPLLVLDSALALRQRGQVSAASAAALSLQPLASRVAFLLKESHNIASMNWELLAEVISDEDEIIIYGFTSILWLAWSEADFPPAIVHALRNRRIRFVHSGGWKKLERIKVDEEKFKTALLKTAGPGSTVTDYYGLVEQVGIVYPLCEYGFRHVPVWADVLVRDPYTLEALESKTGLLQLLNVLAHGAPYHSVLTEDMGITIPGACPCGREGKKFRLEGRLPKAEIRGCANV
ncbi:MAG: hypothetical protein ACLQBD_09400 [Syntrophobacteraceae bacterium]